MRVVLLLFLSIGFAALGCSSSAPDDDESSASSSSAVSDSAAEIGMPFDGSFDRFALSSPDGKDPHHIIYGAYWSTDIYAPPGTAVRFHANVRGRVSSIANTCKNGGVQAGGTTVTVDLLNGAGAKIGVAHYLHLADPRVKVGSAVVDGTVLGDTRRWAYSTCYQVSNDNGVHVHFEAAGTSCWVPSSQTELAEGSPLARIGTSTRKQRCRAAEAPPFTPSPRPTGGPFPALRLASPIVQQGTYITQCSADASGERVWTVSGSGPERNQRWADARYPQEVSASCGKPTAGDVHHPLVFRNHSPGQVGGYVGLCLEDGAGTELVFHIDGTTTVDGHPAASFLYPQISTECP